MLHVRAIHLVMFVAISVAILSAAVATGVLSAQGGIDDEVETLEDLRREQDEVQQENEGTGERIDVATASVDEVTAALDELEAKVRVVEARLGDAEREVESAQRAADSARVRLNEIEVEQLAVDAHITELAVSTFTGERAVSTDGFAELILSDDPGEVVRFRHLLDQQTGTLSDGLDRLRALEVESAVVAVELEEAIADAELALERVAINVAEVEAARAEQLSIVRAAETRLEARLAEAAFLEERDLELASEIRDQQIAINQRVAGIAARNGIALPPAVDLDDITLITFEEFDSEFQIQVNVAIETATQALFEKAFHEGVNLAGWGYRPIQRQIELRATNCGGSEYDIWHRPVFECSPPTARPGFSKHEHGRAIDFTYNGASIVSHDNPGFRWLAANAPRFGFVNLPSEPWHWSIAEGSG